MFYMQTVQAEIHEKCMKNLKSENLEYLCALNLSKANRFLISFFRNPLRSVRNYFLYRVRFKFAGVPYRDSGEQKRTKSNYFCNERIAVYTCIFGQYDTLIEPLCNPDNVDYYVIGDVQPAADSLWKCLPIDEALFPANLSNTDKNRFVKMNPHIFFPNYQFSLYVDGNIKIISDVTEQINQIENCGFAVHRHPSRNCAYQELKACAIYGKITRKDYELMLKKLKQQGLPENFGLFECNIIARRHNDKVCRQIDEKWWSYFSANGKRDQLWLPLVICEMALNPDDISSLGGNRALNMSFRLENHS